MPAIKSALSEAATRERESREEQIAYLCEELKIPADSQGNFTIQTITAWILLNVLNAERADQNKEPFPESYFNL